MRLSNLIFLLVVAGCSPPMAQLKQQTFEPWDGLRSRDVKETSSPTGGPISTTLRIWFVAYKSTFSAYDGNQCRFTPSCSRFGLDATQRMGLYGALATFGRVNKNHLDHEHYVARPPYLVDPLANYTFWMRRPQADDFSAYVDPAHAWFQHVRLTR